MDNSNNTEENKEERVNLGKKQSNDAIDNYKDDTIDSVLSAMNTFINNKCKEHNKKCYGPINYYKIYKNESIIRQLITYKKRLQNVWNSKQQNDCLIYYLIDGSTISMYKNISFKLKTTNNTYYSINESAKTVSMHTKKSSKGNARNDIYYFFILNCDYMEIKNIFIQKQYPIFLIDAIINYLPPKICFVTLYFHETHGRNWDKWDREWNDYHTETLLFKIIKLDNNNNNNAKYFELQNKKCI
eukprot:432874_1